MLYATRRTADRIPLVVPAALSSDTIGNVDCSTINISRGGVKLAFPKDIALPPDFRVTIPTRRISRRARMAWRNGDELGVVFL